MKLLLAFFLFPIFFLGCNNNTSAPRLTGNITGKIYLYSDNGLRQTDNSGAQISIDGSSYSTVSLSDGSWELKDIPAGIYTFVFSKAGYSTLKYYNVQFVGGGTLALGYRSIGQIPKATAKILSLTGPDYRKNFYLQGSITPADSLFRSGYTIFDTTAIPLSSSTSALFGYYFYLPSDSTILNQTIQDINYIIMPYNLKSGTKLYLRIVIKPRGGEAESYNPFTLKNDIFNLQSAMSNLDSLIVP